MKNSISNTGKAYYHKQMTRMTYPYLLLFMIAIFISSLFEKIRFFLFFYVLAATYGYILKQFQKKHFIIEFTDDDIILGKTTLNYNDISSYYHSLALNEFLILRIRTKNGKDTEIYVDKNLKEVIDTFFKNNHISSHKISRDIYLQYGHLKFLFISSIICILCMLVYNFITYKILK